MTLFHQFLRKLVDTVSPRDGLMPVFSEHKKQSPQKPSTTPNTIQNSAKSTAQTPSQTSPQKTDNADIADASEVNQKLSDTPQEIKKKLSFEDIGILYPIPESPYQQALQQAVYTIYCQHINKYNTLPMEIENALYFAIKRYLSHRQYEQDDENYLNGLLTDVAQGKRHHNDVCFYDSDAEDVFRTIKYALVALTVNNSNTRNE